MLRVGDHRVIGEQAEAPFIDLLTGSFGTFEAVAACTTCRAEGTLADAPDAVAVILLTRTIAHNLQTAFGLSIGRIDIADSARAVARFIRHLAST